MLICKTAGLNSRLGLKMPNPTFIRSALAKPVVLRLARVEYFLSFLNL